MYLEDNVTLTLGDGEETDQDESILVSSPDVITHIPDGEIDWMVFVLASCDGNSRLVASEYDGDEECSMRVGIYSDEVLFVVRLVDAGRVCGIYSHIASRPSHQT